MSTMVPQDTVPGTPPPARSGGYAVLRAAGVGVTALVVGAGVLSMAPEMVRQVDDIDLAWPAGTTAVEVRAGVGDVLVREGGPDEEGAISVEKSWSFEEPQVRLTPSPSGLTTLELDCAGGPFRRCHADFSLVVPEGLGVTVRSSAGDVELAGVTGPVTVRSSVGDVRLDGAPETADLSSSVGSVTAVLSEPTSLLSVQTNVGDIDVTLPREAAYDVRSRSDVSDVLTSVREDSGSDYVVDVSTNVGTIRIDDD